MKVKELWYYNIDRVNYRPYFHERIGEQMKRKQKLMSRTIVTDTQNSIFSQNSLKVNSGQDTARESNRADKTPVGSVIGSALKMRDVDGLKLKHLRRSANNVAQVPRTTKHARNVMKIDSGLHSFRE